MSAVIWLGIVAVWAFVLIPTWVRRSDRHWRRSGDVSGARDKIGRAARVINRSGAAGASRARGASAGSRSTVPDMRRPSPAPRRTVAANASSASGGARATAVLDRASAGISAGISTEAPTETLTAIRIDEPPTEQLSAVHPDVDAAVDAAEPLTEPTTTSAQAADAAATETSMPTSHTGRPVPRRGATRVTRTTPTPQVQRARRLVWIGATALATLLLAVIFRGWWVVLNLLADVALVAYLRHLRGIAVQQRAARRGQRQAGRVATERPSESRGRRPAPRRAPAPRHRADEAPARTAAVRATAPSAAPPAPAAPVAPEEVPVEVIDLTDGALHDDCPTTELISARAV